MKKATMEDKKIIEQLNQELKDLIPLKGFRARFELQPSFGEKWRPDFVGKVFFKNLQFKIVGEIVSQQSFSMFKEKISLLKSYAGQDLDSVPVILAEYLSANRRKECQNAGIYFVDMSGNVFLEYGGLYIERVGFPNRFPEKRKGRGPFSDKASLILRAMFPSRGKLWGVRELAESVSLNPGFVSRMARELERRRYVQRVGSKLKIRDPKSILEDWVREYDYQKNKAVRYFSLAKGPDEIIAKVSGADISESVQYAFGLHAGANLVSPYAVYNEVHVYIPSLDNISLLAKKLKLREAEEGGNFVFLLPHYKHSVFYDKKKVRGLWVVSDLQLYLDLYNYPIRGLEQAEHLYEKRLRNIIES
ncbi:MAG: type IV toxin-antitoxin system AbiEi family antitoxin [Desulfobacteraceae bacterium]